MTLRFCDQTVVVDLPKFVTADPNAISVWRIRPRQRPMKRGSIPARLELVEGHDHVGKIVHEVFRDFADPRWCAIVDTDRRILQIKGDHAIRILTTPRLSVALSEVL